MCTCHRSYHPAETPEHERSIGMLGVPGDCVLDSLRTSFGRAQQLAAVDANVVPLLSDSEALTRFLRMISRRDGVAGIAKFRYVFSTFIMCGRRRDCIGRFERT